jgi:maltose O-acetyltransferase
VRIFDRLLLRMFRRARGLDDAARYDEYRARHDIHPSFRFNGPGTMLTSEGKVRLGAHSYIGMHSLLLAKEGTEISIGEHTSISHYFVVYTKNAAADNDFSLPEPSWDIRRGSVSIGNYCWIGFRVLVVEGVRIGDNVVVGAHSVVTKDLESNGIYAGVPARLIRRKDPPAAATATEVAP